MSKSWFSIQNKAASEPVEILIYDQIGKDWFSNDGVSAKEFAEALAAIPKSRDIVVGINSPGGNVWDGLAIYHQLKARGDKVRTRVDGVAASIASVIALAGKLTMPANALMMIHRAWGIAVGNAADMLKLADDLAKHDGIIANIYSQKNGKPQSENMAAMEAETWFNGSEAKLFGLADETSDVVAIAASHDLSRFKNFQAARAGTQIATAPQPDAQAAELSTVPDGAADGVTPTPPVANTNKETPSMSQTATVTAELPTPAPANNADVIAAINALGEKLTRTSNTLPGAEPVRVVVENLGNPLVEKFNALDKNAHDTRANFVRGNHLDLRNSLIATRKGDLGIMAANTVDAALVNTLIAGDFLTTMRTKMAPLAAFSHQISTSPMSARQVLNVNLLSSAGATQDNPTNFETGDTTSTAKTVTLAHVSRSFYTANSEQDLGLALAQKAPTNARIMAEGIMAKVTALMTNANYGADVVVGAAADFSSTDLPAILALGKNYDRTTLLLDGSHLAYLLPTSRESFTFGEAGAYGFDGGIYKNNLWTSAANDICGLVCGPDAIIWGSAPVAAGPNGAALTVSSISLPEIGITVQAHTWYALASRSMWASYDVCFGAAVGDATQAEVLTTA